MCNKEYLNFSSQIKITFGTYFGINPTKHLQDYKRKNMTF